MVSRKRTALILLCVLFVTIPVASVSAYGNSAFESNHIFPQSYFGSKGDTYCFNLREFEHRWLHNSGGFDGDWAKAIGNIDNPKITPYSLRKAAIIAGSRTISYHLSLGNHNKSKGDGRRAYAGLVAMKFDGVSNFLYNVSYMFSIPAKLISFISYARENADLFYGEPSFPYLVTWAVVSSLFGLLQAAFMAILGCIVGALRHPFITLSSLLISFSEPVRTNLVMSVIDLLVATLKSLANIFFWKL